MKTLRAFEIIDYLKGRKHCSINELMTQFNVSTATIHRDLSELTRQKLIQKVHGGVALAPAVPPSGRAGDSPFSARISKETAKKELIAELAAERIIDGDILFLDSSTTALHLARKIQKLSLSNLTVITNSVLIIQEFPLFPPHFFLISLGGIYNLQLHSFLGQSTCDRLEELRLDKTFISAFGLTGAGLTTFHEDHARFLQKVLGRSQESYLLLDSTKYGRSGLFAICPPERVDFLISDQPPPPGLSPLPPHQLLPRKL